MKKGKNVVWSTKDIKNVVPKKYFENRKHARDYCKHWNKAYDTSRFVVVRHEMNLVKKIVWFFMRRKIE